MKLMDILKLQGEIRLKLVTNGVSEELAGIVAGEILDKVMRSITTKDEYCATYSELVDKRD